MHIEVFKQDLTWAIDKQLLFINTTKKLKNKGKNFACV